MPECKSRAAHCTVIQHATNAAGRKLAAAISARDPGVRNGPCLQANSSDSLSENSKFPMPNQCILFAITERQNRQGNSVFVFKVSLDGVQMRQIWPLLSPLPAQKENALDPWLERIALPKFKRLGGLDIVNVRK